LAKTLIVNGKTFNYPEQGEDPIWGEDATAWAEEVTNVLDDLVSAGDIFQTEFTIVNNQSTSADVNGLLLDTSVVRSAVIDYSIYRVSTSNPSGNVENGTIFAVYDNSASSGNKWIISQEKNGEAGVTLDIDDDGQFTYTSTDIGAAGYSGSMKFKSRSITSV
jgi:hypothetical protein